MSIRDYKITDEQFNEKGMTSLPDTLKGTPYENKRSLEKFTREVVAPQFNAIVDKFADMEESANSWSAEEAQRVQQENARQSAEQGRVSMEGQRVTNETARLLAEENRISAENDRVTAETARVNAENKRDSAEKSRVAAENGRVSAESARVTAESQRANAESSRAQNESARVSAETGRADAEADRVNAEDTRIAGETARKTAETGRASAETVRENNENARKSAEKARASAEQQRESAESTRQTAEQSRAGAETARANAEKARADAETARVSAEQARATAKSKWAAAETARQNAETGRTDAETKRVSAENARATAEGKRADAETARATAETKRVSTESARASAESTRQTNETTRVSAEKSRASAETARQTAENARNVWETYSASKAYVPGNKVSFNGSSYVCTAATTGHAPTDTAYWLLIAQKGADGAGAGDMLASVYDPQSKKQDVFGYADTKASAAQSAAATYTDQKIAAIPTPDVSGQIETHNTAADAHAEKFAKYLLLAGGTLTDKFELSAPLGGTYFRLKDNLIEIDANEMGTGSINIAGGGIGRVTISAHQYQTEDSAELVVDGDGGFVTINSSQGGSGIVATRPKAHKVTLTVAGWDSSTKQQTVNCAGVVASETAQQIVPMPAAASMTAYNNAGIQCTAQGAGTLTFTAETVPTAAIDVYVTITPVSFS